MSDQSTAQSIESIVNLIQGIKKKAEGERRWREGVGLDSSSFSGLIDGLRGYICNLNSMVKDDPSIHPVSAAKSMKYNRQLVLEEGDEESAHILDLMQDLISYHIEHVGGMPDPDTIFGAAMSNFYRRG